MRKDEEEDRRESREEKKKEDMYLETNLTHREKLYLLATSEGSTTRKEDQLKKCNKAVEP